MAKAQPAIQLTFDITKKQIEQLVDNMLDFGWFGDEAIKASKVNLKDVRAKLMADTKLAKKLNDELSEMFMDRLQEIIEYPEDYMIGSGISYFEQAAEKIENASDEIQSSKSAQVQAEILANNIKAAADLLKKAGYKITE